MLKLLAKITLTVLIVTALIYSVGLYIMPSVTVINNSDVAIEKAEITLPSNKLDFGGIASKAHNTLYYSLEQGDGVYKYNFVLANKAVFNNFCGYVTQNEVNKRVVITVSNNKVVCN